MWIARLPRTALARKESFNVALRIMNGKKGRCVQKFQALALFRAHTPSQTLRKRFVPFFCVFIFLFQARRKEGMEFMRSELTNNLPISGLVDLVISYFIPRQTILRKEAQQQMRSPEIPLWSYYDSIRNEWKELHLPPLPYEAEQAVDSCLDIIYERHISQFS